MTESSWTNTKCLIKIILHCHSDRHQWHDAKPWPRLKAIQINLGLCPWIWVPFPLVKTIGAHVPWLPSQRGPTTLKLNPPSNLKSCFLVVEKQNVGNCKMHHREVNIILSSLSQGTCLLSPYHRIYEGKMLWELSSGLQTLVSVSHNWNKLPLCAHSLADWSRHQCLDGIQEWWEEWILSAQRIQLFWA